MYKKNHQLTKFIQLKNTTIEKKTSKIYQNLFLGLKRLILFRKTNGNVLPIISMRFSQNYSCRTHHTLKFDEKPAEGKIHLNL